jgi:hypothetical protein
VQDDNVGVEVHAALDPENDQSVNVRPGRRGLELDVELRDTAPRMGAECLRGRVIRGLQRLSLKHPRGEARPYRQVAYERVLSKARVVVMEDHPVEGPSIKRGPRGDVGERREGPSEPDQVCSGGDQ